MMLKALTAQMTEDSNIHIIVIEVGSWPGDLTGSPTQVSGHNGAFDLRTASSIRSGFNWGS